MQNFLNKVFNLAKKGVLIMLIALVATNFLAMIFNTVVAATSYYGVSVSFLTVSFNAINSVNVYAYDNATYLVAAIFEGLVGVALVAMLLVFWLTKKTEWFKVFVIVLLTYYLCVNLEAIFASFILFGLGNAVMVFLAIFAVIYALAVVTVGVLTIIDLVNKTEKFAKIINWILAGMICVLSLVFVFTIVAICIDYLTWNYFIAPIIDFIILALFAGLYNYNRELPVEEKVKEQPVEEPKEETFVEEPKEETPAEEKAEVEEQPAEEVKEEVAIKEPKKVKPAKKSKKEKAPVEEVKEETPEEPKEETPVEEKAEVQEQPVEETPTEEKAEQPAEEPKAEKKAKKPAEKKEKKEKKEKAPVEKVIIPITCPECGGKGARKFSNSFAICQTCGARLKIRRNPNA